MMKQNPGYLDTNRSIRNVYVNVPYCEAKCPWCYIPIRIGDKEKARQYSRALKEQIRSFDIGEVPSGPASVPIERIYFGGGTANLLDPGELVELLDLLKARFVVLETTLVTLEVIPNWLTKDPFEVVRSGGFNRISVAAQSFHDSRLKGLSRTHSSNHCSRTVDAARRAGFVQVATELMWGYPGAENTEMAADFQRAIACGATEVTCQWFNTVPNGTPPELKDRERLEHIYTLARAVAVDAGFTSPSLQVFNQNEVQTPPNGNNGPGIALTDHGAIAGFGWGAKSYIGTQLGVTPGKIEEYLSNPSRPQDFSEIEGVSLELGTMLYQLTAYRSFDGNEFVRFFGYESLEQAVTVSVWLNELLAAGLVLQRHSQDYEVTDAGEALLDMYMAWLGLNNRGGVRT